MVLVRGTHNHSMTGKSKHFSCLEVAKYKDETSLHIFRFHESLESRSNLTWFILAYIDLFAVELICLGVLPNLGDSSNSDIQTSNGGSLVSIKGISFGGGSSDRLGVGVCRSDLLGIFRNLLLHNLCCTEFLGDGFAERFQLGNSIIKGNNSILLHVYSSILVACEGQQCHLLGNVLPAHFTGNGKTKRMEKTLTLHVQVLRKSLHVGTVSLGEGICAAAALIVFNDGLLFSIEENSKWLLRIGEWELTSLELLHKGSSNRVEVSILDHGLCLSIFHLIE
mmetsp:Transcript_666/g.908  ORF Transcript_666/g.908 Transcript_666/m.908 type:complete len:280 (+) Transcript_666:321-1160(+)